MKVAFGHAPGDLNIEEAFTEVVPADQLPHEIEPLGPLVGIGDAGFGQRALEAAKMALDLDHPPIEHAISLIDTVGEQEAAIHDGDLGVLDR